MPRRLSASSIVPGLLVACALLLAAAGPVRAAGELIRLQTEVTDQAGVLSTSEEREVVAALSELRDEAGVQLFIAYIDTTAGEDVNTWTSDTADISSLGGNDALIVVAIEDRSYAMWVGPTLDLSNDAIDGILVDGLEPALVNGDYAGAMVAAARATGRAIAEAGPIATNAPATPSAPTPSPTGTPGASGSGGGGLDITPILAFLLAAGGLFLIARWMVTKRARDKAGAAVRDQLNTEANRSLLATDEALKDAANDVDFAAAQWGDEEVVPYRDAIRQAGDELRASFALRQKLDDAFAEPPPEREQMLREIIARCATAQQLLDAQEQRFDDLQELQRVAPDQLAALPSAIAALRARATTAEQTATRLYATYAPSATASIEGNVAEAAKALDAAAAEAERGMAVVAAKPSDGVVALRRSQEAIARATQLVEAIERLATGLDDAAARLPAELDAAATDVAAARDAVARLGQVPGGPPTIPASPGAAGPAAALAAAEAALDDARRSAQAAPLDPLAAIGRAAAANQAADAILAQVATVQAQVTRRRQVAEAAIATAQGHVTRAADFITTRRHGVGETARTRAAEASMRLDEARSLVATDPESAAASANRATALADEAYRLAAGEFDGWNRGGGPVAGPYAGGGGGGSDIAGAVLGGVIGAVLAGAARGGRAGRGGSGWGGSPWGGSGGMKTGGFGIPRGPIGGRAGGRTRGGGFSLPSGGGGSRGGGGGRVRGGRW